MNQIRVALRQLLSLLSPIGAKARLPRDIWLTVLGAALGWMTSHFYYVKSIDDMRAEAEERRRVDNLIFTSIENIGTMRYTRDASGKVTGVEIHLYGSAKAEATGSAVLTATNPDRSR